jgi:SAM-dependent methyltransferase
MNKNGEENILSTHEINAPTPHNCYLNTADLYDFNNLHVMTEDVPFYVELADQVQGSILELACGTGRVTIPLAKAGHRVTGLDLSPAMLGVFREKLAAGEQDLRNRIELIQGNMANFHLDRVFDLILIPFRAFQALVEEEDAVSCLTCVREHLAPGGLFAVDVFRPYKILGEDWCYPEMLQWEEDDPATGCHVVKKTCNERIDTARQIVYPAYAYEVTSSDGSFRRAEERLALKYYYYGQFRGLIEGCGFHIRDEYGWFDKSPVAGEREMIFLSNKE